MKQKSLSNRKPVSRANRWGYWLRQMELGMGDHFGVIWYQALMFMVLMLGISFGMLGFLRIGASYANDIATRTGAVVTNTPDELRAFQVRLFESFTGGSMPSYDASSVVFEDYASSRMVFARLTTTTDFVNGMSISAQSQVREERFFPGREKCALVNGLEICFE